MKWHPGTEAADVIVITTTALFRWQPDPDRSGLFRREFAGGGSEDMPYAGAGDGVLLFDGLTLERPFVAAPAFVEASFGPGGSYAWGVAASGLPEWRWDPSAGSLDGGRIDLFGGNPYESYWAEPGRLAGVGAGPSPSAPPDQAYRLQFEEPGHWQPVFQAHLVEAGAGNDTVEGGYGDLTASGGAGNDVIRALWGAAILDGGEGDDFLVGGRGRNVLTGGDGDDRLEGGTGQQVLSGDDGNDVIILGTGRACVGGGDGDDIIRTGSGDAVLSGGAGKDSFVVGTGRGVVLVTDFQPGTDRLLLAGDAAPVLLDLGGSTLIDLGIQRVLLSGVEPEAVGALEPG